MEGVKAYFDGGKTGALPEEYLDFLMMKNIYQCTPSEFDEIDESVLAMHREFLGVENDQMHLEAKRAEQRSKLKS